MSPSLPRCGIKWLAGNANKSYGTVAENNEFPFCFNSRTTERCPLQQTVAGGAIINRLFFLSSALKRTKRARREDVLRLRIRRGSLLPSTMIPLPTCLLGQNYSASAALEIARATTSPYAIHQGCDHCMSYHGSVHREGKSASSVTIRTISPQPMTGTHRGLFHGLESLRYSSTW
ncbi:hypothetical protein EDD15DRAFT_1631056 [Pisolithus albus]|nr:hypothetical protein EDD15DRAFT_1631056 [Pisolithus albus]